jgi:hypothetical protein
MRRCVWLLREGLSVTSGARLPKCVSSSSKLLGPVCRDYLSSATSVVTSRLGSKYSTPWRARLLCALVPQPFYVTKEIPR